MSDSGSERALTFCSLDIHMDPLMIASAFSELLDAMLVNSDPTGYTQLSPDELLDVGESESLAKHGPYPRSHVARPSPTKGEPDCLLRTAPPPAPGRWSRRSGPRSTGRLPWAGSARRRILRSQSWPGKNFRR